MSIFTWLPDSNLEKDSAPDVEVAKFGDGYEQRQKKGLNTLQNTWSLRFSNRSAVEADAIDSFLEARSGLDSFEWTPPRWASPVRVVCRKWKTSERSGGIVSITCTFERVYEP